MRWKYTVNDIIRQHCNTIQSLGLNSYQLRHLHNISKCHTAELGGVVLTCTDCGHVQYKYHSCRNRHCPSCQGSKREEWIAKQQQYLLNVPYFHVVFTMPSELHQLCLHKPKVMYKILFDASWSTIKTLAKDKKYLGAQTGMTAVLHTWSQNLSLHPHLHCIVPAGGVTKSGQWRATRNNGKYLFPAKVMARIYRAIFIKQLKQLAKQGVISLSKSLREKLFNKRWVVYAKRPFTHPNHVIEYLGRYTHKVAISNYRLIKVSKTHVTFKWKDYRHGNVKKEMTLSISKFVRRFALHILPHRFVRIRHYGILSNHGRKNTIPTLQQQQNYEPQISLIVERPITGGETCNLCQCNRLITTILTRANTRSP